MAIEAPARLCSVCQKAIDPERLEILPNTTLCVECARVRPPARIDPNSLDLSQASPITRNGFAPKD